MSYIQIEMNGQKVGIKFGYEAVKDFLVRCEENPSDVFNADGTLTVFGIADMIYCGYRNNQNEKKEDVLLPIEDFEDWVLECANSTEGVEILTKVAKTYEESRYVKLTMRMVEGEVKKKMLESSTNELRQPSLQTV
jgi:hypothetical protein